VSVLDPVAFHPCLHQIILPLTDKPRSPSARALLVRAHGTNVNLTWQLRLRIRICLRNTVSVLVLRRLLDITPEDISLKSPAENASYSYLEIVHVVDASDLLSASEPAHGYVYRIGCQRRAQSRVIQTQGREQDFLSGKCTIRGERHT
jgi:hypothetical protein